METNFLGLRTCGYKVADLEKAKNWYAEILGFQPYFDQPFYVGFNIAGYELGLMPLEESETNTVGNNISIYWGVKDIHKSYERLLSLGATTHEAPNNVGGELMVASVRDPWGNIFGLIYNPHFKAE